MKPPVYPLPCCMILLFSAFTLPCFSQYTGIGTSTPQSLLHIKTTTNSEILRLEGITPYITFWNGNSFQGALSAKSTGMDISSVLPITGIALPVTISPGTSVTASFLANGNVGIGTDIPQTRLEVKSPGNAAIKIRSNNYADTTRLVLSNRNMFETGTDFIFSSNQENGLNISSASDLASNTVGSIMLLSPQGKVGIGNATPSSKLDVNGDVNVNGDINVTGRLKVNSNPGTTGQVLVSNGAAAANWENLHLALANTTRFSTTLSSVPNTASGNMSFSVRYNLNPGNITISATTITIHHSGLYHFEVHVVPYIIVASGSSYFGLSLAAGSSFYELSRPHLVPTQGIPNIFVENLDFKIDLYFNAGQTLVLPYSLSGGGASNIDGWLTGYLISD